MRTRKEIHIDFCNYMVQKATKSGRILAVKPEEKKKLGIIKSGLTRNELITALAE